MNKKNYLEIIGVLSLSLILTSTLSVSSCLPEMMKEFPDYSRASLELLISVPASAMVIVIASTSLLARFISERVMVTSGLLIFGIAGIVPVFTKSYELMLLARICLGIGTGLINTRAVSMIGERFSGDLRSRLQGIRCSMETLGQATLTLIAGQLLRLGWRYSFFIYAVAFLILGLFLAFVPESHPSAADKEAYKTSGTMVSRPMTGKEWIFTLLSALLGGLMVSMLVGNSLRMASFVVENRLGTDIEGANILSLSIFAGFLGGLAFGKLLSLFKRFLLPFALVLSALGLFIISGSRQLTTVTIGACICGFFSTLCTSYMFNGVSEHLPVEVLNTANSIALVGCNIGSFSTPLILKAIGSINPELSFGFLAYGFFLILAAVIGYMLICRKRVD